MLTSFYVGIARKNFPTYQFIYNTISSVIFFFFFGSISWKLPQKLPLWTFLRPSTLRDTKTAFLTPKRYHKRLPYYYFFPEFPPELRDEYWPWNTRDTELFYCANYLVPMGTNIFSCFVLFTMDWFVTIRCFPFNKVIISFSYSSIYTKFMVDVVVS